MLAAKASTVTEVTCDNTTRSWHAEMTEIYPEFFRQLAAGITMDAFRIPRSIKFARLIVHHFATVEYTADGHTVNGFHTTVDGSLTGNEVLGTDTAGNYDKSKDKSEQKLEDIRKTMKPI